MFNGFQCFFSINNDGKCWIDEQLDLKLTLIILFFSISFYQELYGRLLICYISCLSLSLSLYDTDTVTSDNDDYTGKR